MKASQQIILVLVVLAVLLGAAIPLTRAGFGSAALPALWWAAGGAGLAALISLIPLMAVVQFRMYDGLPQAALGAMVLRLLLTSGFLLAVTRVVEVPYWPFVILLMMFYLGLLIVETVIALSCRRYLDVPMDRRYAA